MPVLTESDQRQGNDRSSSSHAPGTSSIFNCKHPSSKGLSVRTTRFAWLRLSRKKLALIFYGIISFVAGYYLCPNRTPHVKSQPTDFAEWPPEWDHGEDRTNATIFAAILTAAKNLEQRNSLRETWLQHPYVSAAATKHNGTPGRLVYRFFVGRSNDTTIEQLQKESEKYGDLEILDINDTYKSLPLKRIQSIKWAVESSRIRFQYFLRMDDDLYVNVAKLVDLYAEKRPRERLYAGAVWYQGIPHRFGKWGISRSVYYPSEWPPYVEGAISLMSTDLIRYIYVNSDWLQPMAHLEDVSLAMWMLSLQVHPTSERGILSGNSINRWGKQDMCDEDFLAMPELKTTEIRALHQAKTEGKSLCAVLPPGPVPGLRKRVVTRDKHVEPDFHVESNTGSPSHDEI